MINSINTYTPSKKYPSYNTQRPKIQTVNFGENPFEKGLNKWAEKVANKKGIENFILKIANNSIIKKIAEWVAKEKVVIKDGKEIKKNNLDKLGTISMITYSAALQTNHIINIHRNKQMPEERKETLIVNNALAFVIPTIGALTIDKAIKKSIDKFKVYVAKTKNIPKLAEHQSKGINVLRKVIIFGLMYKYFATIITTPMADKVTDLMRNKGLIGKKNKTELKK